MKVALVGGGGFRTPLVEEALATIVPDVVDELVLHDVDGGRLALIATIAEGRRRERGAGPSVRTTTSLEEATDGAGAVLVAVRPGGLAARVVDERVPLDLGVLGQETVGPAGIAFALRTIPVVEEISHLVRERARDAWLVNFTNPAGIVTEVARRILGDRAIGICDSPAALWRHLEAAFEAPASWRPAYVGLNHLGWLTGVLDGDRSILPSLLGDARIERVHEVSLAGVEAIRARGTIPNEYLVYHRSTARIVGAFRREGSRGEQLVRQQARLARADATTPEAALASWRAAKDERHATYLAEARSRHGGERTDAGAEPTADELGYGGVAAELLRALGGRGSARAIVGVRNGGAVSWLDDDATVEVPTLVGVRGAVIEQPGDVTDDDRALVARVREVEQLTIAATASPTRDAIADAIAAHPVVPSRDLAERIADGYLARHRWLADRVA